VSIFFFFISYGGNPLIQTGNQALPFLFGYVPLSPIISETTGMGINQKNTFLLFDSFDNGGFCINP
jgi:hypothetical protein